MNADPLARWYRWLEYAAFGRALERSRFAYLDRLAGARSVLLLGEGDGRTLARLLSAAPRAEIDVVESSEEMIALARARIGNQDRVRFHQADALTAAWPDHHFDAVITHFVLDCFDEAQAGALIRRLTAMLVPCGLWLISEFSVPERGWRREHARVWIAVMYAFFGATTGLKVRSLPPVEKLMAEAGLGRVESSEGRAGLIRSELWRNSCS